MRILIVLSSIYQMATFGVYNPCTCSQLSEEGECLQSPKCTWTNSRCNLNGAFASSNSKEFQCSNYPQEECRFLRECAFHLGECQKFKNCLMLFRDSCQPSSNYCVPDGKKCIDKSACESYITQIACQSRNLENQYCFWNKSQCESVYACDKLPKSLKTDEQCRSEISHCTVAINGGCIDSPYLCEQHQTESQCHTNYNQTIQCFWNDSQNQCLERICKNGIYQTQEECQTINQNCTTDGIRCIEIYNCSNYQTQLSCKYDKEGNGCIFVSGQCIKKSCSTAPEQYILSEQCNQYLNGKQCVPIFNGGCKDFPIKCSGFETFSSCQTLQDKTECIWRDNLCKVKECSDAPQDYQYSDCLKWIVNCIGQNSGGCTLRPAQCEEIEDSQSCDYEKDQEKNKCFYDTIENQCKTLNCNNLKLPLYSNHSQCQAKLAICTFSQTIGGCFEFNCSNIVESTECVTDFLGFPCTLMGCATKSCSNASQSLDNHQKCELWNSTCTIRQQGGGCESKHELCSEYSESQCYSTINENHCIWRDLQCQHSLCSDASFSSQSSHELCLNEWKVNVGKCTLVHSGQGCQLWPSACTEISFNSLCLRGTADGQSCSWFNSECQVKSCSNAPSNYQSIIQCPKWLQRCTFNNSVCVDQSTIQCSSMNLFTTHSECHEWNSNCTIAPRILEQGCEEKRLCSEYEQESQCKIGSDGQTCQWDSIYSTCSDIPLISCDQIVSKDWSRESCETFNPTCTISNINYTCVAMITSCSLALIQQECQKASSDQQNCYWNTTSDTCEISQCEQNTTASTGYECLQYHSKGKCQLKLNSDGTYGRGCEPTQSSCNEINEEYKCNKSYISTGSCYYISGVCTSTNTANCNQFTQATTNEECQRLKPQCQLHPLGTGCVNTNGCSNILSDACNLVELLNHETCHYESDNTTCITNDNATVFNFESTCLIGHDTRKSKFKWISNDCQDRHCNDIIPNATSHENCQEYQSFCRFNGSNGCQENNLCQDVAQAYCDQATDRNKNFCAWDPDNFTCLSNELCENQKAANGDNKDRICHDWQAFLSTKTCVANPNGDGCILMQSCDQIKIYIQCKSVSKCYWVQGLKCQEFPMCHANKTAISQFECRQYNPYCDLNWNAEKGCNYQECSRVPSSYCDSIVFNNGTYCYLNSTPQCVPFVCSSLTLESDCIFVRSNGSKCYWDGTNCITYSCNQIQNAFNNEDCTTYNKDCLIKLTLTLPNLCKDKTICSDYTSHSSCQIDVSAILCYWNGSSCATALNQCNNYLDQITCNYSKSIDGKSCFWSGQCEVKLCSNINIISPNSSQCYNWAECPFDSDTQSCLDCKTSSSGLCFQHTCSNYNGTLFNLDQCQQWLSSCTINPLANACIDKVDCKQAPKTYNTHSKCQSYLSQCTVANQHPICVSLPSTCTEATDIQCYLDASGNKCYWSDQMNECIALISCDQLSLTLATHLDCNSILASCTVNSSLQGCVSLQNCTEYSEDQCYLSIDNNECTWFNSKCQKKSCETADLLEFTNTGCRDHFNSTCSLNEIGTKCIESPKTCSEYNQFQCSSPDSQNFYGTPCIETILGGCIERVCENSLLILTSISLQNCQFISSACDVDGCRNTECSDIKSHSEEVCQNALPKSIKCSSSPSGCIDRAKCQDALTFSACNFDDNGQQCEWINDLCSPKSCLTAPKNLKFSSECNQYVTGCIPKKTGGCMERLSCPYIEVEEECNIDNANIECNWDYDEQKCQYQECKPVCGDGIVTRGFEECDDGNSVPYDGCYKCQFHCGLGCATCIDQTCYECSIGWQLKEKCETICGDGLVFGKEQCDDMNETQFDGCFQCKFQCDQNCQQCAQGICEECLYGWHLQELNCYSKCGDGILVHQYEQCDDANSLDGDGCSSQCQFEDGWVCIQNHYKITECVFGSIPKMYLTLIKVGRTSEAFLSFSQELQFNGKVDQNRKPVDFVGAYLKDINNEVYQITIKQQNLFKVHSLNALQLTIEIQFLQPIETAILYVQVQDVFVNQYGQSLENLEVSIGMQPPELLSQQAKSVAAGAAQFSQVVMYSLIGLSAISMIMGNMDIFWNLLEQLQFLSYLKYINVKYPENLDIFLDIFSVISLEPFMDLVNFNEMLTSINMPFVESVGKFNDNGISSYFIQNIASTAIIYIFAFIGYYICGLIIKFLNPFKLDLKLEQFLSKFKNIDSVKWRMKLLRFNKYILKTCYNTINYFFYSELIRIYISSSYDILFSTMLQLAKPQFDNFTKQFSYVLTSLTLFSTFGILLVFYTTISSPYPQKHKFMPIFENLDDKNIYTRQYHTFQLIKKILFMTFLVFLQDIPLIQNLVISMITMVNLIYLCQFRPLKDNHEMFKLIIIDFSVVVNTVALSFSIVFFSNSINQAWLNIVLYSLALSMSLGLDVFKYSKRIYLAIMSHRNAQ